MASNEFHVLAVDDEPPNLLLIEEYLDEDDYRLTTVQSGAEALAVLDSDLPVDLVLLDRMMPNMTGMQVIEAMKSRPHAADIPVVMQTAASATAQISEGLAAGVAYYLTKPYKRAVLRSVVANALARYGAQRALRAKAAQQEKALTNLQSVSLAVRTLADVDCIAAWCASLFPRPEAALLGVREMVLNAVEHGNLGITYADKSALNEAGAWAQEVERRLADPVLGRREARVHVDRRADCVVLTIEDDGDGFDCGPYLELDAARATHNHGRGIALARLASFDDVVYEGRGNRVVCTTRR